MIEGRPSRTAYMTAVQRGYHNATSAEPKILHDDLAFAIAGIKEFDEAQAFMDELIDTVAVVTDLNTARTFMSWIGDAVCMRSRIVEEQLALAQKRGIRQLVILGAGLDTTAYRRTDLTKGLKVFEVDHPSTQAWKRVQLKAAGIDVPKNVNFVAFDFEGQTLDEALRLGGVSGDLKTFFTWLGVQMYLTDSAVQATLKVMGAFPKGSEMVMDFVSPAYASKSGDTAQAEDYLQDVVSKMGEPVQSKYTEKELDSALIGAGFNAVHFFKTSWLVDSYLQGNDEAYDMPYEATTFLSAVI